MRFDFRELKTLAEDYGLRTVVLSPFSYSMVISLSLHAPEVFFWRDLTESEKLEASDLLSRFVREVMVNPTLGWVIPISGNTPDNMLDCDGSSYAREDYLELWEVLDAAFKVDANTFRVPDLRRKTVFGVGGDWSMGETGGEENHALTLDEIPLHSHTYTAPFVGDLDFEDVGIPQPATSINPLPQNTSSVGGGQSHNNMPPHQILKWAMVVR